jgi:S-(hydroxymethyl)glutathione dehydrogenase/alcohol dehydrogenase
MEYPQKRQNSTTSTDRDAPALPLACHKAALSCLRLWRACIALLALRHANWIHSMVRAAICRAFGQPLTIEEIVLDDPGPGEVEVDVRACAICHSDITFIEGGWGGRLPAIFGHEAAGIVRRTGAGVTGLKPGDHVVVTLIRSCGSCHYCSAGSTVMCEETFDLDRRDALHSPGGEAMWQAMRSGAFAERVLVHHSQVVQTPRDMPFDLASLLACGVITGYGAVVNSAKVKPGQAVVVVGCGGVGLNAVQGAAHAGANPVIALDLSQAKLDAAMRFGATHGVNPASGDAAKEIMQLTGGRGADHVFVTVGAPRAFDAAFDYVTKNATVVIVGIPASGVKLTYDPVTMNSWNQRLIGSKMGEAVVARDIPALIRSWQEGRLKLEELVSGRYPLERINEAIAGVTRGEALRNVIVFD